MSYVLERWLKRETAYVHRHSALQGFQIKQMIFFSVHSERISAMRNMTGLSVIQENCTFFISIFMAESFIHAGSFIFPNFFKDLLKRRV